jgi:hypothetical protein
MGRDLDIALGARAAAKFHGNEEGALRLVASCQDYAI